MGRDKVQGCTKDQQVLFFGDSKGDGREKGASFVVCFTAPRLWPGRGNRRQWESLTGHNRKSRIPKSNARSRIEVRQRSASGWKGERDERRRGRREGPGRSGVGSCGGRKPLLFAKPPVIFPLFFHFPTPSSYPKCLYCQF